VFLEAKKRALVLNLDHVVAFVESSNGDLVAVMSNDDINVLEDDGAHQLFDRLRDNGVDVIRSRD
jgi:hypothetical protein